MTATERPLSPGETRAASGQGEPPVPPISREQAQAIAEAHLIAHPMPDWVGISEVYAYDEIDFRKPLIYDFPPERMRGYWIAYAKRRDDLLLLCSSEVILVSMESGTVDCVACAHDEG